MRYSCPRVFPASIQVLDLHFKYLRTLVEGGVPEKLLLIVSTPMHGCCPIETPSIGVCIDAIADLYEFNERY